MQQKIYYVYMLLCENGSYYTGYTDNLEKRFQAHLDGSSRCKYTRAFKPIKIAQSWQVDNKSQAMKLEHYIKSLPRMQKEILILQPETLMVETV